MRNPLTTVIERFVDHTEMFYECRDCGTNLESDRGACPTCGSTAVVAYELDAKR